MKKFSDFLEKTEPFYSVIRFAFILAYIVYMVIPKPIMIGFYFGTAVLNFLFFLFYKDYSKNKDMDWKIFMITATVFFISVPIYLLKYVEQYFNTSVPILIKILITVTVLVFSLALLFADSDKKRAKMDEVKVKETLSGSSAGGEKPGDVEICKNKERKSSQYLLINDRYLHSLILGPTGSGKTSQILLKMLYQDIMKNQCVIVIDPKGDFAMRAYAMGVLSKNPVQYFDPTDPDCPYFNPLDGPETQVAETLVTTFHMLSPESNSYFETLNTTLLDRGVKALKRIEAVYTNPATGISSRPATFITLNELLNNTSNKGRELINELRNIPTLTDEERRENLEIAEWFLNEYYKDRSKTYDDASNVRNQINKLIQNEYLRKVLNPASGKSDINFDEIIEKQQRIAINTAQGALEERGRYLGLFLILSIQAAIFRRKGDEFTRTPCFLYIDEFQTYANNSFGTILEQGRSYRVGVVLATQSRARIKTAMGRDGEGFLETVSTNARNVIVFPGCSVDDNKYYSQLFGEELKKEIREGRSKQVFELGHGLNTTSYPTETISEVDKYMARYSPTDINEKPKNEITYRLIENGQVGLPKDGLTSYLDDKITEKLNKIVYDYMNNQEKKRHAIEEDIKRRKQELYTSYQAQKNGGYPTMGTEILSSGIKIEDSGSGFGSTSQPKVGNPTIEGAAPTGEMKIPSDLS